MSYKEPKTETEILSADEQKVREMCFSLKKVDAPKDFDFKLKARIANTKSSDFKPRFGFALRYILPALAMIFVLSFLAYNSGILSSKNNNPVIAESSVAPQAQDLPKNTTASNFSAPENKDQPPENFAASNQNLPKAVDRPQVADNILPNAKNSLSKPKKDSGGGSKDFSSTSAKPEQPNFNGTKNDQRIPQNIERINPMSVKEVLTINGINAEFENGKWTVKSVTSNSVGESSGVKENDVIEAIDNQPLSAETVFNKTVNGKIITVTRNGGKSQIKLLIKQ